MLFSSPIFFVFFFFYFLAHSLLPVYSRIYLIIAGSTIFYSWWKLEYVWIPYLLMAIAFLGVMWIERAKAPRARRSRLVVTIALLFLPLIFFKYTNFIYRNVALVAGRSEVNLFDLPLPLGVSFVTFTLTAFVVDIYRGKFPANTPARTVLAYVLFFPHLIAGPILRPDELIPQLQNPRTRPLLPVAAIAIFTIGLVKKLVFADQIGPVVDAVYGGSGTPSAVEALLAFYGFSVQIYCDFSGYTDMAIGLAMLLGIELPTNFTQPYCSASIVEFWRRWHITLSFWLRDYLYIALGGSRRGRVREVANIVVTMALGGLWHGANWTFVLWGLVHGAVVAGVHMFGRLPMWRWTAHVPRAVWVLVTFHFVSAAWILFRAPDLGRAFAVVRGIAVGNWSDAGAIASVNAFTILLIAVFFLTHGFDDHRRVKGAVARLRPELLWPGVALLWLLAIICSQGTSARFIYFDF